VEFCFDDLIICTEGVGTNVPTGFKKIPTGNCDFPSDRIAMHVDDKEERYIKDMSRTQHLQ
jgi:hypothetical protein